MATPQGPRAPARRRPTGARLPAGNDGYPTGRYLEDVEALLAGYADGGFVVGDEGRILLWSPGAERILGYAAREMIGSPCRDLFVGGTADEADRCDRPCAVVACTMAGGRLSSFEAQARTKAGDPVWLHLSIA